MVIDKKEHKELLLQMIRLSAISVPFPLVEVAAELKKSIQEAHVMSEAPVEAERR